MPRTEAGKRLAAERDACLGVQCQHATDEDIDDIEREAALPDRDALARALANAAHDEGHHFWCRFNADCGLYGDSQPFADAIIAALEEP